jgi:tRNA pseudouridine55 synthase
MIGFINLDKATGLTSHDCVYKVRRSLKLKRVGHGGTLDPKASGVLPIAVGSATRLLSYLPQNKIYQAIIRFGVVTTTDDLEGEIISQQSADHLTFEEIQPYLKRFLGKITQTPPAYSAISVDGVRLYERARKGEVVEAPTRQVDVYSIEVLNWSSGEFPELEVKIACGSGTYIRSIARDLGQVLQVGATLAGLIRLESGGFSLNESITLEELSQGLFSLIPPETALSHLGKITLCRLEAQRFSCGQKISLTETPSSITEKVQVHSPQGFLGVAEYSDLLLTPKIVLEL